MDKKIKFTKSRILFAIVFSLTMLAIATWMILSPEIFIRNQWMSAGRIRVWGVISGVYFLFLSYSFIKIIPRKFAIIVSKDFLIDNSKFEALGAIKWSDISKIQLKKKQSLEVLFYQPMSKNKSIIQKFLLFMGNWNYKKSIIISSALLECTIEELYDVISKAHKDYN